MGRRLCTNPGYHCVQDGCSVGVVEGELSDLGEGGRLRGGVVVLKQATVEVFEQLWSLLGHQLKDFQEGGDGERCTFVAVAPSVQKLLQLVVGL
jgi:hypothetical protein